MDTAKSPWSQLHALVMSSASDEAIADWCEALATTLASEHDTQSEAVLRYWFGEPGASWNPRYRGPSELWFRATPAIDDDIRTRFGALHQAAAGNELDSWTATPRGGLALVLLLDQIPRHIFRGRARMFATDARAREIARTLLDGPALEHLSPPQRAFVWMCLEHAEDPDIVAAAVAGLDALCRDPVTRRGRRFYKSLVRSARQHLELLERFGRYPHRNALLGRESTPDEQAWLDQTHKPRFATSVEPKLDVAPVKLLVLHSFRQSSARLRSRMKSVEAALSSIADLVYVDAPHPYEPSDATRAELVEDFGPDLEDLGDISHQRCWWNSGSDHAHYAGVDASLRHLRTIIAERGPFDGVLGFSQGAAAAGLLVASGAHDPELPESSLRFAICISGFVSRAEEHRAWTRPASIDRPSLHIWGEQDVLVDNHRSAALAETFVDPIIVTHPGGHFVPRLWPVAEIRDFLLAHARPGAACSLDERLRYACKHHRPIGLGAPGRQLWDAVERGADLDQAVVAALRAGAVEDVLVVAWALQRDYDARHAEGLLAPMPGDEFHRLYLLALAHAPEPFMRWVDDIPRVGGWKLLPRLAVFAAIAPPSETHRRLHERIVDLFADRLRREHDASAPISNCAVAAPRTQSATQRKSGLAGAIAARMFPDRDRREAYVAYSRLVGALSNRYRDVNGPVPTLRAQRRQAALHWHDEVTDSPISDEVLRPRPVPVVPCAAEDLEPLLEHLHDKRSVDEQTSFVRGTHMPDGRLDLCKQVVGPAGIGPVLDALSDHPHVSHFMIGNNVVGNAGARAIANFIESGRSPIDVWYIGGNEIDAEGLRPICEALIGNPHVQSLWLKRNPLGPEAGPILARLLRNNDRLHTLDLVNTGLLDAGVRPILEALPHNRGLRHVYLGTNGLGPATARLLAEVLEQNDRLESVFVSCNRLGDDGAAVLAPILASERRLLRLGLSSNRIGATGAASLAEALTQPSTLQFLDLGWTRATAAVGELGNNIGDEGARSLARMLERNRALRALDISHNRISQAGIDAIGSALERNETLALLRHPQHGKAVNHDSIARLHGRLDENWARLVEAPEGEGMTRDDLTTPRSTQEILSVYRTA